MVEVANIYNDIKEISDLGFQEKAWLTNSKSECSSYIEVMCRLFDDNDFDSFIEHDAKKYGFGENLITELTTLQKMLNNYKEKDSDDEIVKDPCWLTIVNQAKYVINLWNESGINI